MSGDLLGIDDDDELVVEGPFRDGKIWVLSEKCSTCIFRPGNLMHLRPGAVEKLVQECLEENTTISCHDTLHDPDRGRSVCRGFYDVHREDVMPLRLAMAYDMIAFDDPPTED